MEDDAVHGAEAGENLAEAGAERGGKGLVDGDGSGGVLDCEFAFQHVLLLVKRGFYVNDYLRDAGK